MCSRCSSRAAGRVMAIKKLAGTAASKEVDSIRRAKLVPRRRKARADKAMQAISARKQ